MKVIESKLDGCVIIEPEVLGDDRGFFLETYQGWGAWFYPQKYIDKLYQISRDNNILFCFDEVQSGFYRMGTLYGYQTYGNYEPDIITKVKTKEHTKQILK